MENVGIDNATNFIRIVLATCKRTFQPLTFLKISSFMDSESSFFDLGSEMRWPKCLASNVVFFFLNL